MTNHRRASLFLVSATTVWGLSFPLTRALAMAQQENLPQASTWFLTAITVALRFGISGFLLLLFAGRRFLRPTRSEWIQGLGLAGFASGGLLFQNDGLFYTTASISAFLTGGYCAIIPLYTAMRLRRRPGWLELISVILVIVGVAILSGVRWNDVRLGRGEIETLICSFFFAGQILLLERAEFHGNRPGAFSMVMFLAIAAVMVGVAISTAQSTGDFARAVHGWPTLFLVSALTLLCTLFTFTTMNRWQPHVTATDAGLIYCLEPVFAASFALFVPGWLGDWLHMPFENEKFTLSLLIGGSAILLANLVVILGPQKSLE